MEVLSERRLVQFKELGVGHRLGLDQTGDRTNRELVSIQANQGPSQGGEGEVRRQMDPGTLQMESHLTGPGQIARIVGGQDSPAGRVYRVDGREEREEAKERGKGEEEEREGR